MSRTRLIGVGLVRVKRVETLGIDMIFYQQVWTKDGENRRRRRGERRKKLDCQALWLFHYHLWRGQHGSNSGRAGKKVAKALDGQRYPCPAE